MWFLCFSDPYRHRMDLMVPPWDSTFPRTISGLDECDLLQTRNLALKFFSIPLTASNASRLLSFGLGLEDAEACYMGRKKFPPWMHYTLKISYSTYLLFCLLFCGSMLYCLNCHLLIMDYRSNG